MRQESVASPTPSRSSWTALAERSGKPVGVDDDSVLQNHAVGVDRYEPRRAAGAVVFHRHGRNAERRAALVAEGNSEAVALLVQGQLVTRVDLGALKRGLDHSKCNVLGAGILNQCL